MTSLEDLRNDLRSKADSKKAKLLSGFFKTGKGEYAEGDVFLGVVVPETRNTAKKFADLLLKDAEELLNSKIHEERLCALLLLVHNFERGDEAKRREIYDFYLKNTKHINNWDLVDLSAHRIVGGFLLDKDKSILFELAKSQSIWERRISVLATFYFIKNNRFDDSLGIAEMLLGDEHDLIHKAVGWMLREVGKRNFDVEERFLLKHHKKMPRTMLRYAIERFPEKRRKEFLKGNL